MRAAWQIHNLCRMEKQEPTPLKKLIRAFFWGNELKAFPLLKSAIFAFPHERHLKPTTATTTWNSKQKPKSAIFCFFSHSFSEKHLMKFFYTVALCKTFLHIIPSLFSAPDDLAVSDDMEKGVINSIKIEGVKGEGDYNLSTKEWSVSSSSASYNVPISAGGLSVSTTPPRRFRGRSGRSSLFSHLSI